MKLEVKNEETLHAVIDGVEVEIFGVLKSAPKGARLVALTATNLEELSKALIPCSSVMVKTKLGSLSLTGFTADCRGFFWKFPEKTAAKKSPSKRVTKKVTL